MGVIDRIKTWWNDPLIEQRSWFDNTFSFNGVTYPFGLQQTLIGTKESISGTFTGFATGALAANPVVFACMSARANLFSEARFMYRQVRSGTPGDLFSRRELELLRHPWPGATTGDLLARTMQDNDLSGNAFWLRRPNRLIRLRPDWLTIIHGSYTDAQMDMWDPEADLLGYAYQPGGPASGRTVIYLPDEVAHVVLGQPDPLAPARGMSWITPLVREVEADSQMTLHKQQYLLNGATPNLIVIGVPGESKERYTEWVDLFSQKHSGVANAYKSMYLTPGMDAKVAGNDLAQVDFKAVQGLGETRIAAAAGVPAAVVGISEGLAGSSLNAGNFQSAMRRFADLTMRPAWRNVCGSFEQIITVPDDAELWYDDRDIPALKDDIKDYAEVQQLQAQAIRQYVDAGYEPESVVDAVKSGDLSRLKHTGLFSVQLQPPMPEGPAPEPAPAPVAPPPRDGLHELLLLAERRTLAAEQRADRPLVQPITVTTPEVRVEPVFTLTPTPVEVRVDAPVVNVEASVVPAPVVTIEAARAPEVTVNVEPTPVEVRVDSPVSVQPAPVEVRVEPAPVTVQTAPSIAITSMPDRVTTRNVKKRARDGSIETVQDMETDA